MLMTIGLVQVHLVITHMLIIQFIVPTPVSVITTQIQSVTAFALLLLLEQV